MIKCVLDSFLLGNFDLNLKPNECMYFKSYLTYIIAHAICWTIFFFADEKFNFASKKHIFTS